MCEPILLQYNHYINRESKNSYDCPLTPYFISFHPYIISADPLLHPHYRHMVLVLCPKGD